MEEGGIDMDINQMKSVDKLKTDTYIVAYIDLLGVTQKIASENNQFAMNSLHSLYLQSIEYTKRIAIEEYRDIKFKVFSDNIIIAKKLSSEPEQRMREIKSLFICTGHFQARAAGDPIGWLMRGGISIGELFVDDVMVWGKALLRTYFLESKVANYPRIIVDDSVINEINGKKEVNDYVKRDFDGLYFLNYLIDCDLVNEYSEMLINGFNKVQESIGGKLDEKIYQKLYWHMDYVNFMMDSQGNNKKLQLSINSL